MLKFTLIRKFFIIRIAIVQKQYPGSHNCSEFSHNLSSKVCYNIYYQITGGMILKKKLAVLLLAACILTACGSNSLITTKNEPVANAVYTNDYVSLAPYTGLKVEKKNYIVTEKAVKNQMHEVMAEFADYQSVSRASKSGDYVQTDFKASIDGSVVVQEEKYDFTIGAEEYGKEFDKKLTGVSIGDELNFSLDFDSDFVDVEWAGKTVDFEIRVTDIQEELLPEPTDAFLSENTAYHSYQEFSDAARKELLELYEEESTQELEENLLQQVIDASSILQYKKEDYKQAEETIHNAYLSYLEIFGMEDLDDVYDFLELTQEDVEEEIQSSLYRTLVINAIIENEHLTLSDEDYENGILHYMEQTETESREEFLNTYSEEEIRTQVLEDKALKFLTDHADVTETDARHEDA